MGSAIIFITCEKCGGSGCIDDDYKDGYKKTTCYDCDYQKIEEYDPNTGIVLTVRLVNPEDGTTILTISDRVKVIKNLFDTLESVDDIIEAWKKAHPTVIGPERLEIIKKHLIDTSHRFPKEEADRLIKALSITD